MPLRGHSRRADHNRECALAEVCAGGRRRSRRSSACSELASVSYAGVAAPLLLLDVVVVARLLGHRPGAGGRRRPAPPPIRTSSCPPAGFGIEDPEDWIAFVTFIGTAVIAGELASRAERRAAEAQAGRQEIERLYQELQAAFERASEAEAARRNEQLKAALLDALTHNLRTPLTAIKAAVTALIRPGVVDAAVGAVRPKAGSSCCR